VNKTGSFSAVQGLCRI